MEETQPRGPSFAWDQIEETLQRVSTAEGPQVMTRLIIVAEMQDGTGKRLLTISSDASGLRLKPWEVEGQLLRAIINSANEYP